MKLSLLCIVFLYVSCVSSFPNIIQDGGKFQDSFTSIAIDSNNHVYTVGYYYNSTTIGSVDSNPSSTNDGFAASYDSSFGTNWVRTFVGTSDDRILACCINHNDDLIVAGFTGGTVSVGSYFITKTNLAGPSTFIARLDSSGGFGWANSDMGDSQPTGIAVDSNNNIYMSAYYSGQFNLGGFNLSNAVVSDWYIAKFNSTGSHIWSYSLHGDGSDVSSSISAFNNEVVIAGNYFSSDFVIESANGSTHVPATTNSAMLIAKYSNQGHLLWYQALPNISIALNSVAFDSSGDVVAGGSCSAPQFFQIGASYVNCITTGALLLKIRNNGLIDWVQVFVNGGNPQVIHSVITNSVNDIFVAGIYYSNLNLGGGGLPSSPATGLFIASFGYLQGTFRWNYGYPGSANGYFVAPDIALSNDSVVVSAPFNGNVTVGSEFASNGADDGLLFVLPLSTVPSPTPTPSPTSSISASPPTSATPTSSVTPSTSISVAPSPSSSPDSDSSSSIPPETVAAAAGAAGGSSCLLIVVAGICWIRRKKKTEDSDTASDSEMDVAMSE